MSKYRNKKTLVDGQVFDSKREAQRYAELCLMQRGGLIADLRCQVPFELVPAQRDAKGKLVERPVKYLADFVYQDCATGERVVEDVKSKPTKTQAFIIKRKLMLERHGIRIQEVKG